MPGPWIPFQKGRLLVPKWRAHATLEVWTVSLPPGNYQTCPMGPETWVGPGAPKALSLPRTNAKRFRSIKHQLWNTSGEFLSWHATLRFHFCGLFLGHVSQTLLFCSLKMSPFKKKGHICSMMHQWTHLLWVTTWKRTYFQVIFKIPN